MYICKKTHKIGETPQPQLANKWVPLENKYRLYDGKKMLKRYPPSLLFTKNHNVTKTLLRNAQLAILNFMSLNYHCTKYSENQISDILSFTVSTSFQTIIQCSTSIQQSLKKKYVRLSKRKSRKIKNFCRKLSDIVCSLYLQGLHWHCFLYLLIRQLQLTLRSNRFWVERRCPL